MFCLRVYLLGKIKVLLLMGAYKSILQQRANSGERNIALKSLKMFSFNRAGMYIYDLLHFIFNHSFI